MKVPGVGVKRRALPLGVRNRLAELILEAFDRHECRTVLAALAGAGDGPVEREAVRAAAEGGWLEGWLEPGSGAPRLRGLDRAQQAALSQRAGAACRLFQATPDAPAAGSLAGLLARAALLADAGLHFEVHELLEPAWLAAEGAARTGLQGLIQVAVGLHHAEHGNRAGAISLLGEGLAKLQAARGGLCLETAPWEQALSGALERLRAGGPLPVLPAWPRPPGGGPTAVEGVETEPPGSAAPHGPCPGW
jgi:hypothetical protein